MSRPFSIAWKGGAAARGHGRGASRHDRMMQSAQRLDDKCERRPSITHFVFKQKPNYGDRETLRSAGPVAASVPGHWVAMLPHVSADVPLQFVSRAGLKLDHALREFKFDVTGLRCADFGCNVGGFTDCLLQRGAVKVYAIDTGYGTLAYKLRTDPRVIVMERTNALHVEPPRNASETDANSGVDLVVIDLAWTPQRLAIPAALRWLKPNGRIITLVKPHYELEEAEKKALLLDGRLDSADAHRVLERVLASMPVWGATPIQHVLSPITGGKSSRGAKGAGNIEFLVLASPG